MIVQINKADKHLSSESAILYAVYLFRRTVTQEP